MVTIIAPSQNNKILHLQAAMGASIASMFVTSVAGVLPFALAYTVPEGIWRNIAFIMSGIICVVFLVWFGLHAYKEEIKLMTANHVNSDE